MMTISEPAATVIDKHPKKTGESVERGNGIIKYNTVEVEPVIPMPQTESAEEVNISKLSNCTTTSTTGVPNGKDNEQKHENMISPENEVKSEPSEKPPKKKRKSVINSGLAKLLEDSMWYIESSGGKRVRESSLRIEKIKEQQIDQMIHDREKEEEEPELTAEQLALQEEKKALRREKNRQALEARKKQQEEQRIRRKQQQEERKRLIAEGKIQPTKKKAASMNFDINNIDNEPYYGGGEIAELLKASAYFTNQGKKFDGSRREVKPVERLLEDEEFAADLRRTSKGKSLKQLSNAGKTKVVTKSRKKKLTKLRKTNNESFLSDLEGSYPSSDFGIAGETNSSGSMKKEIKTEEQELTSDPTPPSEPEPTWFTDFTEDDIEISADWKFFQEFVYQGRNDTFIPDDTIHAADIIRNTIKIYRTDHEVYKLQKVDLHFPFSEYKEHYLLALPKDDVQFNPFDEIGKLMELMAIAFLPPLEKLKVMNLEQPENCIVGRYIKAFEVNDIDGLLKCINEFNYLIDQLRTSGQILEYTKQRTTFPRELIYEILNQCYLRRVLPESKKLSNYKAFSNEVYGELMPSFLTTVYAKCKLDHTCCFIDLGSGVGNCVIQAALENGCESHGVEIVDNASRLGDLQAEEFELRCRIFGLRPGAVNLFSKQSFVNNPPVKKIVDKCNVILVNNYLFDNPLNKKVIELFQDLKVGTKIISLKPIVPATHKINWDNCSSILNRLKTSKFIYQENSVSWTSKGGFYYITEVMCDIVEDNFVVFKSREARRRDEGLDERSRSDTPLNAFTNNV